MTGADRTLRLLERQIGLALDEVETPVAVVELDKLEANLERLQRYATDHAIRLWPHGKTHKAPEIGLKQIALGAEGLTVAKTGEAEVYHEAGVERLLVHYPPIGNAKWERLARLAAEGLELTVAVDGLDAASGLSAALERSGAQAALLVELDVGLHRTGKTSATGALELARALEPLPAVAVAGISGYPGHCRGEPELVRKRLEAGAELLAETHDMFLSAGVCCDRISGGSTPTRYLTHTTCVNELRAGTYAVLDRSDAHTEPAGFEACALWIETTVISNSVPEQVVIDAGSKTFPADVDPRGGIGAILDRPDLQVANLNEEHGYIDVSRSDRPPEIGDRLRIVPTHACSCVNLHDALLGARNGVAERVVVVEARGLVR
jgi:D-serine deaminase-like pyridoxal phosphate-dependent protein